MKASITFEPGEKCPVCDAKLAPVELACVRCDKPALSLEGQAIVLAVDAHVVFHGCAMCLAARFGSFISIEEAARAFAAFQSEPGEPDLSSGKPPVWIDPPAGIDAKPGDAITGREESVATITAPIDTSAQQAAQ